MPDDTTKVAQPKDYTLDYDEMKPALPSLGYIDVIGYDGCNMAGAQHMFLPLILDGRFMLWRLLMYMPFALFAGLFLKLRPALLPYFMIVHTLVDFSAVAVYLMI